MIPCDKVDLTRAAWRTEVASHHHVTELAQMEVRGLFPARTGALVCWTLIRRKEMLRESIQTFDDDSSDSGGNHDDGFQTKEGISGWM